MLNTLFSSEIQIGFLIIILLIIMIYILSVVWTMRDAYSRGAKWRLWGIVSLIPFFGVLAYVLLRPPILLIDKEEQELEIALKQRQLQKYGECSRCLTPVMDDYLVCPNCQQVLKHKCVNCGKPLNFEWNVCPYCATLKHNEGSSASNNLNDQNSRKFKKPWENT